MSTDTSIKDKAADRPMKGVGARLAFAWAFVGIPLSFGVYETAKKAAALFTG